MCSLLLMCSLLHSCTHDQVMSVLIVVGVFAVFIVTIVCLGRIGIEYERRKRAQYDLDALFRSVRDPRGRDG